MTIFDQIYELIWYLVTTAVMLLIVLLLLRSLVIYADVNPFSWPALTIRRLTDPLVSPVRRGLIRLGLEPKIAPLVTVLIAILLGFFAVRLVGDTTFTLSGIVRSLQQGAINRLVGYLLFGLLAIYSLMIFIRIIFEWGVSSVNPVRRFLVRATEPVLGPFRRLIPPLGMFDISSIVVLLLIQLLQQAIVGTLLH